MTLRRLAVIALLPCCGCSALYWGGETTRQPGLTVRQGPGGFELHATADTHAKVRRLKMGNAEVEDAEFGQTPSAVVREEPAKLLAVAELQRSQRDYVAALLTGIRDIAREFMPVLNLLAAAQFTTTESGLTLTLPGGFQIGGQTLTSPADVSAYINAARNSLNQTLEQIAPLED